MLVARIASGTTLAVLGVLWLLVEFLVRPGAKREIGRWSNGEGFLDAALLIEPQTIIGHITRYTIEGRRVYSFVVLTLEIASAVLFFLLLSTLLYLFPLSFPKWWKEQLWKIPLLVLLFDLMYNGLLICLLASFPQPDYFVAWCFVVVNICHQLAHWIIYLLTAVLIFQEARQWLEARYNKVDDR